MQYNILLFRATAAREFQRVFNRVRYIGFLVFLNITNNKEITIDKYSERLEKGIKILKSFLKKINIYT